MIRPWNQEDLFAVLDDEYSRAILMATRDGPKSARMLHEECDMSLATVSRRVNRLVDYGLLWEGTEIDPDGHHYSVYEARLERVEVVLGTDGIDVRVDLREDAADRFTRLWRHMREG